MPHAASGFQGKELVTTLTLARTQRGVPGRPGRQWHALQGRGSSRQATIVQYSTESRLTERVPQPLLHQHVHTHHHPLAQGMQAHLS